MLLIMCKHENFFVIIEFNIENLHHTYECGEVTKGYLPGDIGTIAEFQCLECDHVIRFNKMKPRFKYLEKALIKIGL